MSKRSHKRLLRNFWRAVLGRSKNERARPEIRVFQHRLSNMFDALWRDVGGGKREEFQRYFGGVGEDAAYSEIALVETRAAAELEVGDRGARRDASKEGVERKLGERASNELNAL